ncbi:MAG: hypothetical protein CR984_06910 [Proteobacteria bacterium]|nr:MAG: hypothetical protein CR984_06910 [Pseudomonadota bacterium]
MKRLCMTAFFLAAVSASTVFADTPSVIDIMTRNYELNRTQDRVIEITMEMVNRSGKKRIRRLTSTAMLTSDGINEKRLQRFRFPPDVKGTGFLVEERSDGDDHMWLYLPTLRKSRRKLASNKKDSFLGTEFSYGDVTGPKVSEYTYELKGEEEIDGHACYVIQSTPANDEIRKDYGYSRRIDYIRKDNFTHQKILFYDLKQKLLKTLVCADPFEADPVNHKWFVKRREMINHQNGRKTVLQMEEIQINLGLKDKEFTIRYLERGR